MPPTLLPSGAWGTVSMRKRTSVPKEVREHRPLPIRQKIFLFIIALILVFAALIWVFQMVFMEETYGTINRYQMNRTYEDVENALGDDNFTEQVASFVDETGICIIVYRVEQDKSLTPVATPNGLFGCAIHNLSSSDIRFLFDKAEAGENSYYHRYLKVSPEEETDEEEEEPTLPDGEDTSEKNDQDEEDVVPPIEPNESEMQDVTTTRGVLARVTEGDTRYFILLDCALAPLDPIVRTLRMQLIVVTLFLVAAAVVVAIFISYQISAPIVKLNSKAKSLGQGKLDTDFTVKGYREVTELSETLNIAAEELTRSDRLQKELIGNVSHDLRTPLTMIVGYSEMMRDVPGEATPENMQVVINEATRLGTLVNDLLEISRYQAGSEASHPSLFDLTQAIDETVNSYRHLKADENYRFVWTPGEKAPVWADKNLILRGLCNLLNNAINFAGEDKVIEVRMTHGDTSVKVSVIDHGVGIPPEEQDNIWNRYYRSERTKGKRIGSGLGLSIFSHIMDANGATYGVESAVGVGSSFWFELPFGSPVSDVEE